jgi:nitroreductase
VQLFEAIRRRRMHRRFLPDPVDAAALDRLVWAGSRAPQAGNMPVRRFLVVTDPALVRTVRQVMPSFIANAPAFVLVCTDLELAGSLMGERGRDVVSHIDAGTAAENIALAAVELGLGVCFAQSSTDAAVRAVLDIPEHVRPDIVVAVGRPAPASSAKMRIARPPVDHDRFGVPWVGHA